MYFWITHGSSKKIITDISKYLELDNNEIAIYQNLQNTDKTGRILWYTLEYRCRNECFSTTCTIMDKS